MIYSCYIKKVYISKLPKLVKEYNTIHKTIRIKPVEVKTDVYVNFLVEFNTNPLNLRLIMSESQHIKISFQKVIDQIGQKKCL